MNFVKKVIKKINLKCILSKSTRVQNPTDKILYFRYLLICFKNFLNFFCLFFTITITPNPYLRSVSCSRIVLGGFWSRWFWTRVDFDSIPFDILIFYTNTERRASLKRTLTPCPRWCSTTWRTPNSSSNPTMTP